MSDITALTGELNHTKMRLDAAEKHIAAQEQVAAEKDARIAVLEQELAVVRSAHAKDTARLINERDTWKAEAMQRIADRTFA
jgi:uncharacterized protein (DUF3084 family)